MNMHVNGMLFVGVEEFRGTAVVELYRQDGADLGLVITGTHAPPRSLVIHYC